MNIAHLLLGSAQAFRDVTALARGDAKWLSYRDLWRKVSVMSTHLTGRFGLERGDRVAFAMTNCVESVEVMYAIWHAGLCAVPMNAKLHAKEFAFILENSGAKLCFVTPDLAATIAEAAKEAPALKQIVDVTTRPYTFMEVGDPSVMADVEPTDPAYRDRDVRIDVMDKMGIAGALFFPTLGVGMEQALNDTSVAAKTLRDLAAMLERQPDALLRGRGSQSPASAADFGSAKGAKP